MLKIGLVEPNEVLRKHLAGLLYEISDCDLVEGPQLAQPELRKRILGCDVVMLAVGANDAIDGLRQYLEDMQQTLWIALLDEPVPALMERLLDIGFALTVTKPLDKDALQTILEVSPPAIHVNHLGVPVALEGVIGVWGLQGGVGVTTIAANLAAGIAQQTEKPVCLTETTTGPTQLPGIAGVSSKRGLEVVGWLEDTYSLAALRTIVAPTAYQVGVISAAPHLNPVLAARNPRWAGDSLRKLRESPLYVVVDCGSAWNPVVAQAMVHFTDLVLVCGNEEDDIAKGMQQNHSVRQMLSTNPHVHLALSAIQEDHRLPLEALRQQFHADSVVVFPHDQKTVRNMWNRHQPLLKNDRGSRWRQTRDELVKTIVTN